ncbi:MAG: hypothetical protein L6Q57_04985 [Alphaproteobacteria bacterium]|nr:hypothetical protein [Alphaproteobacteria bacterium]
MAYRDSASFGRRQEYGAFAELLKRGYDVYATLVDDQQIDCVVRLDKEPPVYIDIQIKARSKTAKNSGTFSAMTIKNPRANFFYIFYSEGADCYWIIPSLDIVEKANVNKDGKNKGKYRLVLANQRVDGSWHPRPKWKEYENDFDRLAAAADHISMPAKQTRSSK